MNDIGTPPCNVPKSHAGHPAIKKRILTEQKLPRKATFHFSGEFTSFHLPICQVKKTRAVQEGRWADAQKGHGRRIVPVGPFPRHGKRAVRSPLENQRFPPSYSPEFEDQKPLSLKRMERMGDFRRARRRAAVKCSYR